MTRHRADTSTGDLFALPCAAPQIPGTMNYRAPVSELTGRMLQDAHAAGMDRHEVAARVSRLVGHTVSKATLDSYTAVGREAFNVPLWFAPVLEVVCESTALAEWHGQLVGGQLLMGAAAIDAEIGRQETLRHNAADRLRKLKDLRRRIG